MDSTTLEGKWEDPYVQMLGALEHADEVLTLHRHLCGAKADRDAEAIETATRCLAGELADLFIILHKMWDEDTGIGGEGFRDTVAERMGRFRP